MLGQLSAPFALPASGVWSNLPPNSALSGSTNLTFEFDSSSALRPIQQVDLFLDGIYQQTISNIPPRTNNVLSVSLNGFSTNYTVTLTLTDSKDVVTSRSTSTTTKPAKTGP